MKIKNFMLVWAVVLLCGSITHSAKGCDISSVSIYQITDLGNGEYQFDLRLCAGSGMEGLKRGGDANTGRIAFWTYGATISSFTPTFTSSQTGEIYTGVLYLQDSVLLYNGVGWFTSVSSGPIQPICVDVTIVTSGLPDSIYALGVEGSDNLFGGCYGQADMRIIPGCFDFSVNGGNYQVYSGYTSAYECTNIQPTISGGTSPFTYAWNTGATTSSISVCPSSTTVYSVTVTDATGCQRLGLADVNVMNVSCGNNKVAFCYNGTNYCKPKSQIQNYLNQGATLGVCGSSKSNIDYVAGNEATNSIQISPNPATGNAWMEIDLQETQVVSIGIYDISGREVQSFFEGEIPGGMVTRKSFSVESLPKGMYFVRLKSRTGINLIQKLLVQ